jgi:hypothetical protein
MRKRGTSRNKTCLSRACFAHNLFIYSNHVKLGLNGVHGAHFNSSGDPRKYAKQTVNRTRRLQVINGNIRFDKFISIHHFYYATEYSLKELK